MSTFVQEFIFSCLVKCLLLGRLGICPCKFSIVKIWKVLDNRLYNNDCSNTSHQQVLDSYIQVVAGYDNGTNRAGEFLTGHSEKKRSKKY